MIKYPPGAGRFHLAKADKFRPVYIAMLLLALQGAVTLFVHSTYLEQFVDERAIGPLFMVGSVLSIFAFIFIGDALRRWGNYKLTLGFVAIDFIALLGMGLIPNVWAALLLFVIHQAVTPLLFFNIDLFLEKITGKQEESTGTRRGIMLTIFSLASAVTPLGAGFILGGADPRFMLVYVVSALMLLPFAFFIFKTFSTFRDDPYPDTQLAAGIKSFWHEQNVRFVFCAHFLLQLFFSWMVIYVPLYLAVEIGFKWSEIGAILFVGLLAYVFLEYPVGRVADLYLGEKEMMAIGFLILAVSTIWISFLSTAALIPWMVTMFLTRAGASFVEATTESYFFDHRPRSDANIISLFRILRPFSMVIGAVLGSVMLLIMPFQFIFIVLGALMFLGIAFTLLLEDTR